MGSLLPQEATNSCRHIPAKGAAVKKNGKVLIFCLGTDRKTYFKLYSPWTNGNHTICQSVSSWQKGLVQTIKLLEPATYEGGYNVLGEHLNNKGFIIIFIITHMRP